MILDKKQIWAILKFEEFKMFHKAAETTYNINNAFGSGTGMNVQCSSGSRSFAKETRVLKMRSAVAGHQKVTTSTVLWLFGIWSKSSSVHSVVSDFCSPTGCSTPGLPVQIRKVKKLDEWVSHELTTNPKKKSSFWSVIFSYSTQQQTISWWIVMWGKKWVLYDNWQWSAQ